ncbi:MAG TPA: serine hydrolase domain-containing protein [Acidimicrobiales bacterium]|nr:serine hydrolase domain-containing protein [Acidimicrobiales bacterium]
MKDQVKRWMDETVEQHHLTGLAVGVLHGDERVELATGWVNKEAGIEARPDAVHQIGSITKVYTTTIVNRLLTEGGLSLDDPLPDLVPELRLKGDPDLSGVRVRHLLTHTSGLPGDAFLETGEGDENLARWIEALAGEDATLEAEPGVRWSYCNTAFSLLGRIVEHRMGIPFRQAMRDVVTRPLGILTPVVTAREALRFRVAVGHVRTPDGESLSRPWAALPVSSAPAGSTPTARVGDVLTFARAHLDPADDRLGSRASLDALQEAQVDMPSSMADSQALGWMIHVTTPKVIGHGGSTQTQNAMLLASADPSFITIVLSNDLHGGRAIRHLTRTLWGELAGVDLFADPVETALDDAFDVSLLAGTYERYGCRVDVASGQGRGLGIRVATTTAGETVTMDLEQVAPTSADGRRWMARQPLQDAVSSIEFREWDHGRPFVLHFGGRANLRRD